jgi:predicted MPP superfamily phosphohydrolase
LPTTDPNKKPIRLLHLSDLHLCAGTAWDHKPVLRDLTRFIADEAGRGMVSDLVVITGDLAFSGKTSDYELVREWLDVTGVRMTSTAFGRRLAMVACVRPCAGFLPVDF